MVKAELINEVPPPMEVSLKMSRKDASLLMGICGSIGGAGKHRDVTDQVYSVLADLGIVADAPKWKPGCSPFLKEWE